MNETLERAKLINEIKKMFGLVSQFGAIDRDTSLFKVRRIYAEQTAAINYLKGANHEQEHTSN